MYVIADLFLPFILVICFLIVCLGGEGFEQVFATVDISWSFKPDMLNVVLKLTRLGATNNNNEDYVYIIN